MSNIQYAHAQEFSINQLPVPGMMLNPSVPFAPLALKGLIVNIKKPLEFQFIIDSGRDSKNTAAVKEEANQLVKYFLAGLTIPGGDLWVNLSPYEKNKIAPEALGQTDLGRDLLAQDYILKQLTASLIYPERDLGKEFWKKVYAKAQEQFGTTNIPVNTFNKVWILPNEAEVFENENVAYVTKSTLKVMLDEDYLAKQKNQRTKTSSISSQIVREIVLPEIEKEVNEGKNFATLRQIYQALILAKWYKETIQNRLMDTLYTNKKKVKGVNVNDPAIKEEIYQRYLKAYKKGAFNYIKEDLMSDGQGAPRKYFSGGITQMGTFPLAKTYDSTMLTKSWSAASAFFLLTVNCGARDPQPLNIDIEVKEAAISLVKENPKPQKVETLPVADKTPTELIKQDSIQLEQQVKPASQEMVAPVASTDKKGFDYAKFFKPVVKVYDQAMIGILVTAGIVGYFIYLILKNIFFKKDEKKQEGGLVPLQVQVPNNSNNQHQQIDVSQTSRQQTSTATVAIIGQPSSNSHLPQASSQLPSSLRQEIENQIIQLGNAVAESSKMILIRSFRPTGPSELPLPIPITMLNQDATDRDRVIHILENMQRMMDGTDEKVLRDFERAIDNARDRVTEEALNRFDHISDRETLDLLTNGYVLELQREFQRIFDEQVMHMDRFYAPSYQEQDLYVSDEINERYPRLPRYLKWILSNNPDLENDYYVREWLNMMQGRVNQIPKFPDMITGYSKVALTKSLYLNPELAKRVLLFLTQNTSRNGYSTTVEVRDIQLELARSLADDPIIEGEVIPIEEVGPNALEAPTPMKALPAPDLDKNESKKTQLKALLDNFNQFMIKHRELQDAVIKAENDLRELSEGLVEAKKQNDRVIINALQPAVDGTAGRIQKLKERMPRLEQEK